MFGMNDDQPPSVAGGADEAAMEQRILHELGELRREVRRLHEDVERNQRLLRETEKMLRQFEDKIARSR